MVSRGRKLGGILVEVQAAGGAPFAVCGTGINVSTPLVAKAGIDEPRPLAPIGLRELVPKPPPPMELAEQVRDALVIRVDAWAHAAGELSRSEGPLAPLLDDYRARLALLGAPVVALSTAGEPLAQGTFLRVDAWGHAVVATSEGPRRFSAEEASLPAPRALAPRAVGRPPSRPPPPFVRPQKTRLLD